MRAAGSELNGSWMAHRRLGVFGAGQSHEVKSRTIGRAFSPPISQLSPETQADGLGWYIGAPLALSSAGTLEAFPVRIAIPLGVRPIHAIALPLLLVMANLSLGVVFASFGAAPFEKT